jgi:hypothetical protein
LWKIADTNMVIEPGIYRHYKGGLYEVIGEGTHSETLEKLVIYKSLYDKPDYPVGSIWVRPLGMFVETVEVDGRMVRRFEYVKPI